MSADNPFIKHLIKVIEPSLLQPNWPHLPTFPYEKFSGIASEQLGLKNLQIEFVKADWQANDVVHTMFGKDPQYFSFHLAPIPFPLFLLFAKDDLHKLTRWTLSEEINNESLSTAYLEFTLSKILRTIDHLGMYKGLRPILTNDPLPSEDVYVINVTLQYDQETLPLAIVCPSTFHQEFIRHFHNKPFTLTDFDTIENVLLPTPLELGSVEMTKNEWEGVREGDWVILDRCSYHPLEKKGTLTMVLYDTPLFQLKIKEDQLKVLDYIFYQEGLSMHPKDSNDEDDSFYEDLSTNSEDLYEEEDSSDHEESNPPEIPSETPSLTAADNIPLTIRIEAGSLNMNLKELIQIKPGSVIPFATHPEREVKLTLNGRVIALGELIEMDDAVGVKITQLP